MPPPVVSADPTLRRRVLAALVLVVLLGLAGLVLLQDHLAQIQTLAETRPLEALRGLWRLFTLMGLGLVAGAALLWLQLGVTALRVLHSGRYPPPGMRVVRDTPLREGREARRRALGMLLVGMLAFLGAAALHLYLQGLAQRLAGLV